MRKDQKIFIIAEAGVNHNGSLKIARRMVDVAAKAGVDAVKFQTFKAEKLALKSSPKAAYQEKRSLGKTQFEMLKKLELSESDFRKLFDHCRKKGIIFLSSPFDVESVKFLDKLGLKIFKIPSGEITNYPYLRNIGLLKKRVILSTGMSTMSEVRNAMDVLMQSGTKKKDIIILHCNTEYPTPYEDVNLRVMMNMRNKLKVEVGYSDHTLGIEVSIAAAALGASVIEKHFTLNRNMLGPDHVASLEPADLRNMVQAIRHIEKAMGDGIKRVTLSEWKNMVVARKSIVAVRDIKKGDFFDTDNMSTKRPGSGLSPMLWNEVLGRRASKDFQVEEMISL